MLSNSVIPYLNKKVILAKRKFSTHSVKRKVPNGVKKFVYQLCKKYQASKLRKLDSASVPNAPGEIRLFAIMRNESLRLPYFLEYYKNLGVDRFFLISNNSVDKSIDIALSHQNVHVFETDSSFEHHWFWMECVLESYGKGHWCVVVDIDELFSFPYYEWLCLKDLCCFLDTSGSTALRSFLLDIYASSSIQNTGYSPGQNPLEILSYFDRHYQTFKRVFFDRSKWCSFVSTSFHGGVRERVFKQHDPLPVLSKVSVFKYLPGTYLVQGMHAINGAKVSEVQGVVFHTKFLFDFVTEVAEECEREQHYGKAVFYKSFRQKLEHSPDLGLFGGESVKLIDSSQLVELGLMKTPDCFKGFARSSPGKVMRAGKKFGESE